MNYKSISVEEADTLFSCGIEFEYTTYAKEEWQKYSNIGNYPDCVAPTVWVDRINRTPFFRVQTE